jgi:hypothetical protein
VVSGVKQTLRPLAIAALVAAFNVAPASARSFRDMLPEVARETGLEGGTAFDALADALADTAARTIPILSASAGFTYRYNPQAEVFERTSDTLGPIFLERPDTLGRNKFNINVSYQYVNLDEFDGDDTDSLENPNPLVARVTDIDGTLTGFTANRLRYDFSLVNHVTAISATYGVLDQLDVNLLIPIIVTKFDVDASRQVVATADTDGAFGPLDENAPIITGSDDGTRTGVGDILLRGKYQLPRWAWLRSAAGLTFRMPSGDEDDFQGTGAFEVSPNLYLSTLCWGRLEPHANVGVDLNTDDVARSQVRYGLGADVDITKRIGIALGFLGRSEFEGVADDEDTQFLHLVNGSLVQQPLLGLDFDQKNYFDLSFGARAVVWRQVMLFVNGIYALNDDGLRDSTIIPTIGVEGTF